MPCSCIPPAPSWGPKAPSHPGVLGVPSFPTDSIQRTGRGQSLMGPGLLSGLTGGLLAGDRFLAGRCEPGEGTWKGVSWTKEREKAAASPSRSPRSTDLKRREKTGWGLPALNRRCGKAVMLVVGFLRQTRH